MKSKETLIRGTILKFLKQLSIHSKLQTTQLINISLNSLSLKTCLVNSKLFHLPFLFNLVNLPEKFFNLGWGSSAYRGYRWLINRQFCVIEIVFHRRRGQMTLVKVTCVILLCTHHHSCFCVSWRQISLWAFHHYILLVAIPGQPFTQFLFVSLLSRQELIFTPVKDVLVDT